MTRDELFEVLPEQAKPRSDAGAAGAPRLREPVRDQIELRPVDLDSLIAEDHPVRVFWAYAEKLDLSEVIAAIKSWEGHPGHPAITPHLLVALLLYGISRGVGSARALARLCESDDAFRWLCGGVSVNYHTLADFRVGHAELLDRLLAENVAALADAGLIDFATLAQDGIKVRAAAGAAWFRRRARLERMLASAISVVEHLKDEVHDDPAATSKRIRAARERTARERVENIRATLKTLGEVEKVRKKREKKNHNQTKKQKEPRASTSDPQARIMKMADGGFRPAYNVQVVSVPEEQIVVAVEPVTVGSDRGLMGPMLDHVHQRTGHLPERYLADGGFGCAEDIERAHREGTAVFCPPTKSKHGGDPFAPKRDDGPGVLAWRERMASESGKAWYKTRAMCECIHARWRNWNLIRLTVRDVPKVRSVMVWYALANNILQGHRLMQAAA